MWVSSASLLLVLLILFLLLLFFLFLLLLLLRWFLLLLLGGVVLVRVDRLTNFHRRVLESLEGFGDSLLILSNDGLIDCADVGAHLVLDVLGDLGSVLLQLLLSVVDELVSLIGEIDDYVDAYDAMVDKLKN